MFSPSKTRHSGTRHHPDLADAWLGAIAISGLTAILKRIIGVLTLVSMTLGFSVGRDNESRN